MLGPMGAYVISALRVMTPSEIDRYAKTYSKKKVTALAAGAEDFDLSDSHASPQGNTSHGGGFKPMTEAEIIPIDSRRGDSQRREGQTQEQPSAFQNEKEAHPVEARQESVSEGSKDLESIGIFSADRINAAKKAANDAERSKEDSSTVFLLKQRQRLKNTNNRMVGNTALKTYAQTANAEIIQTEIDPDDPDQEIVQGSKGILINRKHF